MLSNLFAQSGDWLIGVCPAAAQNQNGNGDGCAQVGLNVWGVGSIGDGEISLPTLQSDHMFQQWFWFGTGDAPERALDSLTLVSASHGENPDTIVLSYGDSNAGDPISVQVTYSVLGSSLTNSAISETVTITNLTNDVLNLRWFELTDIDLEGTEDDDSAALTDLGHIHQTDPLGSFVDTLPFQSPPPSHFEIAAYPAIHDSLNDSMVTTLSDMTSPFGPGDVEHAFQWDIMLAAANSTGDSVTIQKTKSGAFALPAAVEIDEFEQSTAMIGLQFPDDSTQNISLQGPTAVRVNFEGPQEGMANDNDGNDREEVPTEIVSMTLFGVLPNGGSAFLNSRFDVPSLGQIEETMNNTPGTLDVPPFAQTGTADSFFDVFFDVFVPFDPQQPLQLHNETPARMQATITHKPPAVDEMFVLQNGPIELFTLDNQPTGIFLVSAKHTPNPTLLDFGDAPESYGTLLSSAANPNPGPSHTPSDLVLGRLIDPEPDGQPSVNADGDDLNTGPPFFGDDEDGLVLNSFSIGLMGGLSA